MPGPLPDPNRIRKQPGAIPTTTLPAEGRTAPPPACPYDLDLPGQRWWEWAWHTPQACAWDDGSLYAVARRAQLEDGDRTISILREARELDDRLGLTPKGRINLRLTIKAAEEQAPAGTSDEVTAKREERKSRLKAS